MKRHGRLEHRTEGAEDPLRVKRFLSYPLKLTKDSPLRRAVAPQVLNFCYHTKTDVMGHLEIIARADMRSGTRPPHLEHPSQRLDKEDCVQLDNTAAAHRC